MLLQVKWPPCGDYNARMSRLDAGLQKMLGLSLDPDQEAAFARYAVELAEWNQRVNLTAIQKPEEIEVKHFLDSLSCWLALREQPGPRVIDVGSGAGFPGLPLKILQPDLRLTLVEATGKKADFLSHIVQVLGLEGVEVLPARAEEVGQMAEHREAYDWALARAVAPLSVLAEYLLPLVKPDGRALAMKGPGAQAELAAAEAAIQTLGGEAGEALPVQVPGLEAERFLTVIHKVSATPTKYPRRPGMPAKRPLG